MRPVKITFGEMRSGGGPTGILVYCTAIFVRRFDPMLDHLAYGFSFVVIFRGRVVPALAPCIARNKKQLITVDQQDSRGTNSFRYGRAIAG
jgi:hypothetical protein